MPYAIIGTFGKYTRDWTIWGCCTTHDKAEEMRDFFSRALRVVPVSEAAYKILKENLLPLEELNLKNELCYAREGGIDIARLLVTNSGVVTREESESFLVRLVLDKENEGEL